jgi:hypothetical protein
LTFCAWFALLLYRSLLQSEDSIVLKCQIAMIMSTPWSFYPGDYCIACGGKYDIISLLSFLFTYLRNYKNMQNNKPYGGNRSRLNCFSIQLMS